MLKRLTLRNWKSFGEDRNELELASLSLLVGPNASGKSNALDALRFLQGAALDYPLGDVLRGRWEGQREIWPAIRGHVVEAARAKQRVFELHATWDGRPKSGHCLTHSIEVDTQADASLEFEQVIRGEYDYAFTTRTPSLTGFRDGGNIKAQLRSVGKGNKVAITCSAARSLLGQVAEGGRVAPSAIADAHWIRSALRSIVFLDIAPARMRDYRPEHVGVLGTSGENISPVLKAMSQAQRDDVVAWLGELCAPAVTGIDFDETALKEVMFFLQEGETAKVSARSVSDGTLRFLGLVTALLTAAPGSMIVLEEPDVGLHPSRIHLLAQLLEQVTSDGGVQVLATTHSPTLLAHLSDDSLGNVIALGRGEDGATICSRLETLPHFATLRDSKQLDHLVSTGWIERAL